MNTDDNKSSKPSAVITPLDRHRSKPRIDLDAGATILGGAGPQEAEARPERPFFELADEKMGELKVQVMRELARMRLGIYRRGKHLVRVFDDPTIDENGREKKNATVSVVDVEWLQIILEVKCGWKQWKNRGMVETGLPDQKIARGILALQGDWEFPFLRGVISAPTLRPDGSLLSKPGYDARTGLYLADPPPMQLKEHPTREDALASLALLDGLLDEFPFADDASRSAALSMQMSAVLRGAIMPAPGHATKAPKGGAGKSCLGDLPCIMAVGRVAVPVGATKDAKEFEKKLTTALLMGDPIISMDNLVGPQDNPLLCQVITQTTVDVRPFGTTKGYRLDGCPLIFMNGNTNAGFSLVGDMVRRCLQIEFVEESECAWQREFKRDPRAEVAADRGKYIAAVLTIVLAFLADEEKEEFIAKLPVLANGFAGWDRFVRAPLVWLGREDPATTIEAVWKDSPELQRIAVVLVAMAQKFGMGQERRKTSAEIVRAATGGLDVLSADLDLLTALEEVTCEEGGKLTVPKLSYWLRSAKGQVVAGMKLCGKENSNSKLTEWWLEPARRSSPVSPEASH
jgi:putative DNA primase/helicase